jgi:hypothetical protein
VLIEARRHAARAVAPVILIGALADCDELLTGSDA